MWLMIHALLFAAALTLSPGQIDVMLGSAEKAFHNYVFPEVAAKTVALLRRNTARYERLSDPQAFKAAVNADLYAATHDKHVRMAYPMPALFSPPQGNADALHHLEAFGNYGFNEVRHLAGNVGYISISYFSNDPQAGGAVASAMQFVAGTDALIIDLRHNGGGSPITAQTLEAYFFAQQQQLTSILARDPDTGAVTEYQQYTAATVPGPLYLDKPVYVLTSDRTGSCAEQFAYDLHNLKRVTLVGLTTAGAANPGDFHPIGNDFGIFVPFGRAYSPMTKTNWEGTGIAPDVSTPADDALVRAYTMALQQAQKREKQPELADAVTKALADPAKALDQ